MAKTASRTVRPQEIRQLYDEDIVLWSEQQAGALRALKGVRDLPPELDIDNVVEEIETVERNETAAVESMIRQIFLHLLKIAGEPEALSVRHWMGEIVGFSAEAISRYAPSMRQKIDLDRVWRSARRQIITGASDAGGALLEASPVQCPFGLDDLLVTSIEPATLVEKLRLASAGR
ncbi:MAG: DUF29 domain-containing protein [Bauldia sp.]|nr:DUF29 domain-containing protein [Bauldia sp.]